MNDPGEGGSFSTEFHRQPSVVDCLLLFAPQFFPVAPPAGLGYLTSHLKHRGMQVHGEDLNAQLYDRMLSGRFLSELGALGKLRASMNPGGSTEKFENFVSRIDDCGARIEEAKRSLKSAALYVDRGGLTAVLSTVADALNLVSTLVYPGFLSLGSAGLPGTSSPSDIVDAARSEQDLIVGFLRRRLRTLLGAFRSRVVGISSADNIEFALVVAALVRDIDPERIVVLGGPAATASRSILRNHPDFFDLVDAVVVFDGEVALPLVIEAATRGSADLSRIPNLLYRVPGGDEVESTPIDTYPLETVRPPDFSSLDLSLYLSPGPVMPVEIGRGCYWNACTFCNRPIAFSHNATAWRRKSAGQVVDEIRHTVDRHGTDSFYFVDDAVPPVVLLEISRELIDQRQNIRWMALSRFERPLDSVEELRVLKRAGCSKLGFGLESSVPRVLQLMNKGIRVSRVEKIIESSNRIQLPLHLWVILGFPTETGDEALETLKFVERMLPLLDVPGFSLQITPYRLERSSLVNTCPDAYAISDRRLGRRVFQSSYETFHRNGLEATSPSFDELVDAFKKELVERSSCPELLTEEYILGFIYGMFASSQATNCIPELKPWGM